MSAEPELWLIVPCYNEARRLDVAAFTEFAAQPYAPMLLFVDDGSTDDTRSVLRAIEAASPARCRVLEQPANAGKAEAVRCGLNAALEAGAAYVAYWDADLATPLPQVRAFEECIAKRPDIDAVIGSRVRMLGRSIDRSGARHLIGRAYATLASVVLGLPVYDTQCGAKLFRATPALHAALARPFRAGWSFDVELLLRLQREWGDRGMNRIIEVPLPTWRDVGESKVSLLNGGTAFLGLFRMLFSRNGALPMETESADTERTT